MGWDEQESVMEENLKEDTDDESDGAELIIFSVFFEFGLAPLSLFLGWLLHHQPLARFAWRGPDVGWGLLATVPLILMILTIMRWPIGPLVRIRRFWVSEVIPLLARTSWSEIALISFSAGVGEEMLFRGVLQSSFIGWFGPYWGLTVTSLLFGLFHPISIPYVVIACVVSFYLGTLLIVNGNLMTVIIVHAVYDFSLLAYLIRFRGTESPDPDAR